MLVHTIYDYAIKFETITVKKYTISFHENNTVDIFKFFKEL